MMEPRVGLLFLVLLGASWACDARQFGDKISENVARNDNVCELCEEFSAKAVDYFSENKTQTEITDKLHMACSRLPSFKQQCVTLVDYYAPLFFLEISTVQPADFCQKVNLCQQIAAISSQLQKDSCGLCHRTVSEIIDKLKDPDTQLDILELLLKGCNSMEKYAKKCKRLVFAYAPLILTSAEQFIETRDLCTILHACKSPAAGREQAAEAATVLAADS